MIFVTILVVAHCLICVFLLGYIVIPAYRSDKEKQ